MRLSYQQTHSKNFKAIITVFCAAVLALLLPTVVGAQCSPILPVPDQVPVRNPLGGPPILVPQPDHDGDGIPNVVETKLIERFSPLLRFTMQKDNGSENYRPMDMVDYVRNSDMVVHNHSEQLVIPNSKLRTNPGLVITGVNNILTTYEQQHCASNANLRQESALQGQLDKHSDNNPDIGTYDLGAEWSQITAKGSIGMYAHVSPFWPNSLSDLPSQNPRMKDDGKPVIEPSGYEATCRTVPIPQPGKDLCYKIEYYQFFGFNQAWQDLGYANHQADLAMLTEIYDVPKDRILAVSHWAHGFEMRYDLQSAKSVCNDHDFDKIIGEERTCTGENVKHTDFNILYANLLTGAHQSEPWKAQNNQVSFAQDPVTNEYSHPVVFVESGSHEFWPTSKWGAEYAPSHAGNDPFNHYIARNIPNLGD